MNAMRALGFFLLLAGGGLALLALILLSGKNALPIFLLAGLGVEILGLIVLARSHFALAQTPAGQTSAEKE
jgi:hypothetical protein